MLLFLTTSMSISIGIVKSSTIFRILFIILLLPNFDCRKHRLIIKNDIRSSIPITTFGFLSDGTLDVDVNSFIYHPNDLDQATVSSKFGFSLARTLSSTSLSNIKNHGFQNCILNKKADSFSNIGIVLMKFEIQNNSVLLECNSALSELRIFSTDLPLPQKISTVKTVSDHDSEHRSKKEITGISATNSRQISQKDDGIIQIDVESNNLKSLCSRNSFRLIPELAGKNQYSFKVKSIFFSI
ncbi:caspase-10-like [Sarcoptes scabiei]|nr:caspase-10-like [Sarcoptes scabiei]